ncbi:MAG: hypothetical protein MHM6MM_004099 [Cercozoa sp. M6MM]
MGQDTSAMTPTVLNAIRPHTATVIFLHGLGDTAAGWASELAQIQKQALPWVKFILPTAPIRRVTLNGGFPMTAWHDIKSLEDVDSEDFDGLQESIDRIHQLISAEDDASRVMVAGFSQGAATALLSTYRYPERLAACAALSGYLPWHADFAANLSEANKSTPCRMFHGEYDPVVKPQFAKRSLAVLKAANVPCELMRYPMEHSACPDEMRSFVQFVQQHLPEQVSDAQQQEKAEL